MSIDVARLQRALDSLDSGACGDPECCGGPDPWPTAEDLAAAYVRERICSCGSTETLEVCRGDQCIRICSECGSDEP